MTRMLLIILDLCTYRRSLSISGGQYYDGIFHASYSALMHNITQGQKIATQAGRRMVNACA